MNAEEELSKLLSEELAKSIDAEILKNIMALSTNQIRKKHIDKIFKARFSELSEVSLLAPELWTGPS